MKSLSDIANYAGNLTYLTSTVGTIAQVCSDIGINRQQFNKYLTGQHLPSRRNQAKIAKHFLVSEKDFYLPTNLVRKMYAGTGQDLMNAVRSSPELNDHTTRVLAEERELADYSGIYYRYQVSSIYQNTVLRSVLKIYEKEGFHFYYYVERFKNLDNPRSTAFSFRYHGLCNRIGGKLFLIDTESSGNNEMTFAALTPIARKPQSMMFGIACGVAANVFREPYATKVALVLEARGKLMPSHMRKASSLDLSDLSVPEEVRVYLGIVRGEKGFVLRGN